MTTLEQARAFVAKATWTRAKGQYTDRDPHEYAARKKWQAAGHDDAEYDAMVVLIKAHGERRRHGKNRYWYFDVDGMTYWTMTGVPGMTYVINRDSLARLADEARNAPQMRLEVGQ